MIDHKREWVRDQLVTLESLHLVQRSDLSGKRPDIIVLKDDGSGDPFDDPGALVAAGIYDPTNTYVSVHGAVISDSRFRDWTGAELAAYYCAMTAEVEDPHPPKIGDSGSGTWYRQIDWFRGQYRRPIEVVYKFGERTLRTGLATLERQGWLVRHRRSRYNGERFAHPRTIYTNRFREASVNADVIDLVEILRSA